MLPLTVSQLARYLGGSSNNQQLLFSASVDSRKKGDLFFALPGSRQDGHDFLQQVAKSGAIAAVVSKSYTGPSYGLELIFVENVLKALQDLGRLSVKKSGAKIVAITGSLGKTTTKQFLTALLRSRFSVFSDSGNANSQIGLPLALLALKDEETAVIEMGMTDYGHIKKLTEIAPPDVALITTVSLVHASSFEGILGIAKAKAEIFSHDETWQGLFLQEMPGSDIALYTGRCPKTTFSVVDKGAPFFAEVSEGKIFVYEKGQLCLKAAWSILGRHNVQNFLAAATAARKMGLSWHDIERAVSTLVLPERRLQLVEKKGMLFINDSYNASRESICGALEALTDLAGTRRRVAVLSEMLELGDYAEEEHRAVGSYALGKVDQIYCIGAGARPIKALFEEAGRCCHYYEDKEELKKTLQNELKEGDVVLVKGGRLYNLGDLLENI